jgi:two-component system, LuxR family, sensor kinase FixL
MKLLEIPRWRWPARSPQHSSHEPYPLWVPAIVVALAYYIGAHIGFALTRLPNPIAVLWPPNAVLMAALLLAPARHWPWLVLAALPAHLIAQWQSDVPMTMIVCWFISNVTEAVIGSWLVRRWLRETPTLTTVRSITVFVLCAVLAAPFLTSFLDAAFVTLIGWGQAGYWQLWTTRFASNVLGTLTIVPLALTWLDRRRRALVAPERRWEGVVLLLGLLAVGTAVFATANPGAPGAQTLLYLPLPFLLWASLRFGPQGASAAFAIVAFMTIWGAAHGLGPFVTETTSERAIGIQIFLISAGAPLLFLAAVITERKEAELRLTESEDRFASIFRAIPDPVFIVRAADDTVVDVNDRWQSLFGYSRAAVMGRPMHELTSTSPRASRSSFPALPAIAGKAGDGLVEMRTADGTPKQTIWSMSSVRIRGDDCTVAIVHDLTQQRRTEAELREQRHELMHLSRVARLSSLAGSLAHELCQPLTAILSNAQAARRILAREPLDQQEIADILDDIVEADKRAGDVIRGLRTLVKKGEDQFSALSLNDAAREALLLAHGEFVNHGVAVTTELATDLPLVSGDMVLIQHLLLNLFSNACEAMQATPRLQRSLYIATAAGPQHTACLTVSDSGPGFAIDQLDRLFEPFFTTKEQGLGMGLSICRSIVELHGGTIHAACESGRGATIRVVIPAVDPAAV